MRPKSSFRCANKNEATFSFIKAANVLDILALQFVKYVFFFALTSIFAINKEVRLDWHHHKMIKNSYVYNKCDQSMTMILKFP